MDVPNVNTTCKNCTSGAYQPEQGASSCLTCPLGSRRVNRTLCLPCEAGTAGTRAGAALCSVCTPGQYQPLVGASACVPCPIGQYTDTAGSIVCTLCPIGSYCPITGLGTAIPCPVNTFSARVGTQICPLCPPGTVRSDTLDEGGCVDENGNYLSLNSTSYVDDMTELYDSPTNPARKSTVLIILLVVFGVFGVAMLVVGLASGGIRAKYALLRNRT